MAPRSWSTHAGGANGGDMGGAGGPAGGSGGSEGGCGESIKISLGDEGGGYAESPPPHAQHLRAGSYRRGEKGARRGQGS